MLALRFTVIVFLALFGACTHAAPPPSPSAAPSHYPAFSWDRVPVAGDFRTEHALTEPEAQFIARHYALVSIEKGQGRKSQPKDAQYSEDGFAQATRLLKRANPAIKVLFYWNASFHYPMYRASGAFRGDWCIKERGKAAGECRLDARKRIRYDLSVPAFRQWWVRSAATAVRTAGADGVFIDAVSRSDPAQLLEMLAELSAELKPNNQHLILFNDVPGQRANAPGDLVLEATAGVMLEDFDRPGHSDPDQLRADLESVIEAGRRGKIVLFKAWPGFTHLEKALIDRPYAQRLAEARSRITFPLACFLVAAQPYAYFQYSWSWEEPDGGNLVYRADGSLDPAWYPELLRPLGPPLGDAVVTGYSYRREFRSAIVSVDLKSRESRIEWR